MLFVDGENLTLRAQEICKATGRTLDAGRFWRRDTFLWFGGQQAKNSLAHPGAALPLQGYATRASYYTSVTGSDHELDETRQALWNLGFTPVVFRKVKGSRSKGVDITLTKDMLTHAFHDHYDVAVLITGDADYEPVVGEVRRQGKAVHLCAFTTGLADRLRLACDSFTTLDNRLNALPFVPPATAPPASSAS